MKVAFFFLGFGQQRPEISEAVVGTSHSLLWYSLITPAASDSELSNFWCLNPTWKTHIFSYFLDVSMICLKIDGRGHPTALSYFPPTIFDMRQWPACWFIPDFQHGMQPHWNLAPRRCGYSILAHRISQDGSKQHMTSKKKHGSWQVTLRPSEFLRNSLLL